ncbi:hypothetical protein BHM03_00038906, partial [Ensete ventricosum]
YVVYKIDEKSREMMVDKVGRPGDSYEGLAASLPLNDLRRTGWMLVCVNRKCYLLLQVPNGVVKQGLRRLLEGIHYEVQATDAAEMGFDVIKERAK